MSTAFSMVPVTQLKHSLGVKLWSLASFLWLSKGSKQHCLTELSVMIEIFYVCAAQQGSLLHEHLKCVTKELKFQINTTENSVPEFC